MSKTEGLKARDTKNRSLNQWGVFRSPPQIHPQVQSPLPVCNGAPLPECVPHPPLSIYLSLIVHLKQLLFYEAFLGVIA